MDIYLIVLMNWSDLWIMMSSLSHQDGTLRVEHGIMNESLESLETWDKGIKGYI